MLRTWSIKIHTWRYLPALPYLTSSHVCALWFAMCLWVCVRTKCSWQRVIFAFCVLCIRIIKPRRMRWREHIYHAWNGREMLKNCFFSWRKGQLEYLGVDGRIIFKWVKGKQGWSVWPGFVWVRIGTNGRLLYTRQWTFGFHNIFGITDYQSSHWFLNNGSAAHSLLELPVKVCGCSTVLCQMAISVIMGRFAGRTWKCNGKW
jgi:hypothetical protein